MLGMAIPDVEIWKVGRLRVPDWCGVESYKIIDIPEGTPYLLVQTLLL